MTNKFIKATLYFIIFDKWQNDSIILKTAAVFLW